jgi:rhodanese-related sulfurtransferase/rubrerythrin
MKWKQFLTPVESMNTEEARDYINRHKEGTFTLLDVRQPEEYEEARIPGAKLIPLPDLPNRIEEIDLENPTIVYCAIGGRSRVGAQILAGKGFREVYNLKGGIKAWHGLKITGPVDTGLTFFQGNEQPSEVVALAYGMEEGLGSFYKTMASKTTDQDVKDMFTKLAGIEAIHKQKLLELYRHIDPSISDVDAVEESIVAKATEGGFTTEEFLKQNQAVMNTVQDVLSIAMMIEGQALDLYTRYAEMSKDDKTKDLLLSIAEEEKAHLTSLGHIMGGKVSF